MDPTIGDNGSALIVANHSPSVIACLRSLSSRNIHTIAASWENETVPGFASKYCDEALVLPSPYEGLLEYKDALLSIASRADVRTFVPMGEVDTYLLAKYPDEFAEYVSVVVPPLETLRRVHDRVLLYEAAKEAEVPAPRTQLVTEVEDWDRELIIKSRYNLLVAEYLQSYTPDACDHIKSIKYCSPGEKPDIHALCEEMGHVPIAQEFVPKSNEYLFGALYDEGEPVTTFQHRQVRGETYAGGGGSYRESVTIPRLEKVSRTLLDHLDWHGLACIEFMEDARTGEIKLTEINPRMWRSLPFAVHAGADFPYDYWLLATGRPEQIETEYEVGIGGHLLYGEVGYLKSVLFDDYSNVEKPSAWKTIRDIVISCYEEPNFDYLHLDDPGPFIRGLINVLPFVGDLKGGPRHKIRKKFDPDAPERDSDAAAQDGMGDDQDRSSD